MSLRKGTRYAPSIPLNGGSVLIKGWVEAILFASKISACKFRAAALFEFLVTVFNYWIVGIPQGFAMRGHMVFQF